MSGMEGSAAARRICFVCLGNICRSPLAEGVFRHLAQRAGRDEQFEVESAGVGRWYLGEPPDHRAQQVARRRGLALVSRAQQFRSGDFARFDLVIALDHDVGDSLRAMAPSAAERAKVRLLREFDPQAGDSRDVPDPYYGDLKLFEHVYEVIERSCAGLLGALPAAN
jgi:protein-tyrosine phosphatase